MVKVTYYAKLGEETIGGEKYITGIIPQLGVATSGGSRESALERMADALKCYLDTCKDIGKKVPKPKNLKNAEAITVEIE